MKFFTSFKDVVTYVRQALGDYEDTFDVEAIASEISEWSNGMLKVDDAETFWTVAARNAF